MVLALLLLAAAFPAEDARNGPVIDRNHHFSFPGYRTRAEWEARKAQLRRQILIAAGLDPLPERCPLNAQIFGRIERGDYSVEKVLLETLPGYYLAGNLYRPVGKKGKFPGVLNPHGHWKKGRLEHTETASVPARCVNFARQGYVAFAYDMVGYNDTRQTAHAFAGPAEELWAFGPLGLQLWNSMRAADFLASLPDVDARRLAMTGASGGGTQTFLLAAVDGRVTVSAPVNMVSAYMQGGSPCENAPGLRAGAYNVEFAAMMAPRPQLLVAATGDWTKNVPREECPDVRGIYALYGKPDRLGCVQSDAGHNYNRESREAVYAFFARHVRQIESKPVETGFAPEKDEDMLALSGRELPRGALDYPALLAQWKEAARRQSARLDARALKERLRLTLRVEWPRGVLSSGDGKNLVLSREGRGDRVPGVLMQGRGSPVLIVHPGGAGEGIASQEAAGWIRAGRTVLAIDAFQTGTARTERKAPHKFYSTFHLTDSQNRVQDILTALKFLAARGGGRPRLAGLGEAAVWALFAAAASPLDVQLDADVSGFRGQDKEYEELFFVPGIQRAGGLDAALRLTERARRKSD